MGFILFLVMVGIPVGLASLLSKLAERWIEGKALVGLLMMALGLGTAWVGYQVGVVGYEEVEGYSVAVTTYPVAGGLGMLAGVAIVLWGLGVMVSKGTVQAESEESEVAESSSNPQ